MYKNFIRHAKVPFGFVFFIWLLASPAKAWFIFIPGSVTSAISDAITGDKGEHCVTRGAKAGDVVTDVAGGRWRVESVSGESMRCASDKPIRAMLVPIGMQSASTQPGSSPLPPPSNTPQLGNFNPTLNSSWSSKPLYPHLKEKLIQGYFAHDSKEWELMYGSLTRASMKLSVQKYAEQVRAAVPPRLSNALQTEITSREGQGKTVYMFEREGQVPDGTQIRYHVSVFAFDGDLVLLQQWSKASSFADFRQRMNALSMELAGIETPFDPPLQQTFVPAATEAPPAQNTPSLTSSESSKSNSYPSVASGSNTKAGQENDPTARLSKLKELHDRGLISKEEYEAKRKKILSTL